MTDVQTLGVPGSTGSVPSQYQQYHVSRGWQPTPVQRLRLFVSGLPGDGKTNFVNSNPDAWILDLEDSGRDVVNPRAARIYLPRFSDYLGLLDQLCTDGENGNAPCGHVTFDSFDKFIELSIRHLTEVHNATSDKKIRSMTEYGDRGAGWFRIRDFVMHYLTRLYLAGYGWTVVGNCIPDEDQSNGMKPVIPPSTVASLNREAQFIVTLTRDTVRKTIQEGEKTITTAKGRKLTSPIMKTVSSQEVKMLLVGDANDTKRGNRDMKARYLERITRVITLPLEDGWGAFASAYGEATKTP